jgi:MerR family transcriptional regulator, thiopeptide resistance regulator
MSIDTRFDEVIPLLVCSDITAEHDFLVHVLGLSPAVVERMPDGKVVHAEVVAGSRRVWLHRADEAEGLVPPRRSGSAAGGLVIHVGDVDAHHERARAAGADILYAPRDEDYGQREYGIRDPEGHLWWIATPIGAGP